jgi:hypothetical protein
MPLDQPAIIPLGLILMLLTLVRTILMLLSRGLPFLLIFLLLPFI